MAWETERSVLPLRGQTGAISSRGESGAQQSTPPMKVTCGGAHSVTLRQKACSRINARVQFVGDDYNK